MNWMLARYAMVACLCPLANAGADECTDLKQISLPGVVIDRADSIAGGDNGFAKAIGMPAASLPALCRVAATLRPSSDSDIKIEVWLPQANWNTKLLAVGNGGWSGVIGFAAMAPGLQRGYAVTATDTGHSGSAFDGSFAFRHPEKLIDFGWRAVHEMTVTAKAIVDVYYSPKLTRSYWQGCSSGGKQGLKEAQMFPADYDGVIAGAPAVPWTRLSAASLWVGRATLPVGSPSFLTPAHMKLIADAAVAQCDRNDGVAEGVIEDPRACTFEPSSLKCSGPAAATCLTQAQIDAVNQIYAPLRHPRSNAYLYAGFAKGSEAGWGLLAGGPKPLSIANDHYRFVVFQNADWDFTTLDVGKDVERADAIDANGAQLNAASPDLDAFRKRGGKVLMYHGWADALIPAQNSIDYFESVWSRDDVERTQSGLSRLQRDIRLFMAPGMGHCGGGAGPGVFDALSALEVWVEQGRAPEVLIAEGGSPRRTRPLCAYPQVATYLGRGNTNEAASFTCK